MRTDALIAFAAAHGHSRVAMRGNSMLPSLREPYVLEIGASKGKLRVGGIAVFRAGRRLVAHRIVKLAGTSVWCSGDAHPAQVERISRDDVLGVVERVMADETANARRVDGLWFRLRGFVNARTRALRAVCVDALPSLRPRVYWALFQAVSAVVRGDDESLRASLASEELWRLAATAQRHRCGPLLVEALARLKDDENASALREQLLRSHRSATLRTAKLREQLSDVLRILDQQNIQPVLLKGTARTWNREPGFALHDSGDLDLLVLGEDVERGRDALMAAGYREHVAGPAKTYYDTVHHHTAPLSPPGLGVTVELHRALAPRGDLTIPTTLEALSPFVEHLQLEDGQTRVLDQVGTTLSLVVHSYRRPALRDIYLIAKLLQQMGDSKRSALEDALRQERNEHVRMQALLATSAQWAGLSWPGDTKIRRFAAWMLQREDLPRVLRARTECWDAWLAYDRGRVRRLLAAACHTTPLEEKSSHPFSRLYRQLRPIVRLVCGGVIPLYVRFRRPA